MTAAAIALQHLRNPDKAWLAVLAIFVALALAVPQQAQVSLGFVAEALADIAPILLIAVLGAAAIKATGGDGLIARVFEGREKTMVLTAALFGALSPFCSCGVIPLVAALLSMGVPLPAIMAFWLASPLMDPSMFLVTAGALGVEFAVAKTISAFGIGWLGGLATQALMAGGLFADPVRDGIGNGGCSGSKVRVVRDMHWKFWQEEDRRSSFRRESVRTALFLVKWLSLAYLLESLMVAYVPAEWITGLLGGDSVWAIPLAVITGVPAYLNGYAAIGLMDGLVEAGMMPGAALAFMIAGGVTSIPAAIAVYALARKPVFVWYLTLSGLGALGAGFLFQAYLSV